MRKPNHPEAGLSLLEVVVAAGILVVVLASLYNLYGQSLRALRSTLNASYAKAHLLEQAEIVRNCTWGQLAGTTGLPANLLPLPSTSPNLSAMTATNLVQTLRVCAPLQVGSGSTMNQNLTEYYSVTRSGNGGLSSFTVPSSATTQLAITCILKVQWTEKNRTISQQQTVFLSREALSPAL